MRKLATLSLTSAIAIMAPLAAPLAAQQSVQDFRLPDPDATPTPAPRAQGPVDDTGIVPVAPRVIPTDRPTATPTATPTPTASPSASEATGEEETRTSPQPRFTSGPVPAEPLQRPIQQPSSGSSNPPAILPDPSIEDIDTGATAEIPGLTADPSTIPATPVTNPDAAAESAATSVDALPWGMIGAALAVLLAIIGGFLFWRRRETEPPTIEAPVVGAAAETPSAAAGERPRFVASVQIESAQRSMMMVMVKYRLTIANRSERALRELEVGADLVSARRQGGLDAQLATLATPLPATSTIERIGPHQTQTVCGTLQLALQEVEVLRQGSTPMFVPLLRVKVEGENIEPFVETYAVGLGNAGAGAKLHPLPLNGPPGSYEGVRAKPLAAKAA